MKINIKEILKDHPFEVPFCSILGSRAYGYATEESDYDIHGVHLLSEKFIFGFSNGCETVRIQTEIIDFYSHDLKKCIELILKGNGNVLEDILSENILISNDLHKELQYYARGCITKRLATFYKEMAHSQQEKLASHEVKKLLHSYRCLLMGIHAMRTGSIEMNLLSYNNKKVNELIKIKNENIFILPELFKNECFHELQKLTLQLEEERKKSNLPNQPTTRDELENFLIRTRKAMK